MRILRAETLCTVLYTMNAIAPRWFEHRPQDSKSCILPLYYGAIFGVSAENFTRVNIVTGYYALVQHTYKKPARIERTWMELQSITWPICQGFFFNRTFFKSSKLITGFEPIKNLYRRFMIPFHHTSMLNFNNVVA